MVSRFWIICLIAMGGLLATARAADPDHDLLEHFEKKIRPLLAARCWECHGEEEQESGLRLDSAAGVRRGSEFGPVVVPGNPDESRLIQAIRHTGEIEMPPEESLTDLEIADLVAWVRGGAVWPETTSIRLDRKPPDGSLFTDREKSYWAFQPIRDPEPPKVQSTEWVQSDVDRFIVARLEAQGLAPAVCANKRTLLRRVTFDLIGLPPTPDELDAFLTDESPEYFSKVVNRLLNSPQYGERWGRRWLGVVRYGDTADIGGTMLSRYAYRYRDYVVNAFNQDKPYDEFIVEQIAGDLLDPTDNVGESTERVIATGFLQLGPKPVSETDKEKMVMQIVDEQIDVTGRAFLGMTVACARCHDHKFDPIPTRDYYSLAGIFYSTQTMADLKRVDSKWMERPLDVPGEKEPIMVLAVQDGKPTNLRVNIRGNHLELGEEAPRRFLQIIAGENQPAIDSKRSGRLELARWIASPKNPLTARVMVNRIWQGHFGRGLIEPSDNFGAAGQLPTHPELLDWLASRFIEGGWSVKAMHHLLLTTSTYQMSTTADSHRVDPKSEVPNPQSIDPENRLLWRMNPRRLEAEEIRDSILATNGRLDRTVGGNLFANYMPYLSNIIDEEREIYAIEVVGKTFHPHFIPRRSIYLPMVRQKIPEIFLLFDFGDASAVTTRRSETTVAPQALYLMNSSFVHEESFYLARQLLSLDNTNDEGRVRFAHLKLFGRPPTLEETSSAVGYLGRIQRTLDEVGRSQATIFPSGAVLSLTLERAPHGRKLYDPDKPIFENPSGIRLRLSVSSTTSNGADWTVLSPDRVTATKGRALSIGPDQTMTVLGGDPISDTYEIIAHTEEKRIAAIRLEVLPDPAELPERAVPDLFVLADFHVRASPAGNSGDEPNDARTIFLQSATLKRSDKDVSIRPVIDADPTTYWPVGPQRDQPGVVIFETEATRVTAWQSYCRALFCLNEFIYLD